ncbi:hypothetical protein CJ185_005605 [Gleimia europaea]|nr:hypothetical protein [Gleimia europaea]WIK62007.1 hypothetical protein CJ185_005605 [Gleimia europaea]
MKVWLLTATSLAPIQATAFARSSSFSEVSVTMRSPGDAVFDFAKMVPSMKLLVSFPEIP